MTQRARVLYIEDNPDNRMLIKRVLEADGYQVVLAEDAATGLAAATAQVPDVILVDINLPGLDGFALIHQIKATPGLSEVRIVAVTANVMKGDRERTLAAGCDGYIQKPIDVDTLPQQIAHYLRNPAVS